MKITAIVKKILKIKNKLLLNTFYKELKISTEIVYVSISKIIASRVFIGP